MNSTIDDVNVTALVEFGEVDGESLPIKKCVCGTAYSPWHFPISIYRDAIGHKCCECGRKFYFRNSIAVFEVKNEQ